MPEFAGANESEPPEIIRSPQYPKHGKSMRIAATYHLRHRKFQRTPSLAGFLKLPGVIEMNFLNVITEQLTVNSMSDSGFSDYCLTDNKHVHFNQMLRLRFVKLNTSSSYHTCLFWFELLSV